jgi:hypothetical protein
MMTTLWTTIILVVVLALGLNSAASPAIASPDPSPNSTKFSVQFQNGLLSVEAEERAWRKFLDPQVRKVIGVQLDKDKVDPDSHK